ncbi:MAG: hypothetical protein NT150_09190 [Bacteroidetes bacterium]|nr:hypothetical protein [Bacteroidota bacterium]
MSREDNNIPSFDYKPEYRKEMEDILVKRKSKKRFLFFFTWTVGALLLAAGLFYLMQDGSDTNKQVPEAVNAGVPEKQQDVVKENTSVVSIEQHQEATSPQVVVAEKPAQQELKAKNSAENRVQLEVKNKKSTARENVVNTIRPEDFSQQKVEEKEVVQEEKQSNEVAADEAVKSDSAVQAEAAAVSEPINTETVVAFDEVFALLQNADSASTDTVAKAQMDSIAKATGHEWVLHFGAGANTSIGEGEYSNGIAPSFKLGVNYLKDFSKGNSFGIGLQAKLYNGLYSWGGYDTVKLSIANPNSSGYEKMEARVVSHNQNKYAMALSVPLYYRHSAAKYSVGVGASIDYLMLNQYQQSTDSSKYGINTFVLYTEVLVDKTSGAKTNKQDFAGINRLNFGPFVEFDYQLFPNISMGLMGQMLVQDITNNNIVNINKNNPLYSLNVSLKYHFCKL